MKLIESMGGLRGAGLVWTEALAYEKRANTLLGTRDWLGGELDQHPSSGMILVSELGIVGSLANHFN